MPEDARVSIRRFICTKFPEIALKDDEDIFALGFVSSLFAMELVMYVEKAFDIRVPNQELRIDNFRTLDTMAGLVKRISDGRVSAG